MTDKKKSTPPVKLKEPVGGMSESGGQSRGLSEEDRAALRYVRYLKCYDDGYDEEGGWDVAGTLGKDLPEKEIKVHKQVRELREFYQHAMAYAGVLVVLLLINLMVSPGTLWVLWVALGWGVGLGFYALDVFRPNLLFGRDWERREVMKQLERVGRPASGR